MPNYQNGKIYKIISPSNSDIPPYYGATTQQLCVRMAGHRIIGKKPCNSRILIECGDAIIVLVENFSCNSKEELCSKEADYIVNNDCINRNIPFRTKKEYREANKDKMKQYRENNKEKLKEKRDEHYKANREKLIGISKDYQTQNKDKIKKQRKQFYEVNKEMLKEKGKGYREKNKDKTAKRRSEKHLCICGSSYCICDKARHERTEKHLKHINVLNTSL